MSIQIRRFIALALIAMTALLSGCGSVALPKVPLLKPAEVSVASSVSTAPGVASGQTSQQPDSPAMLLIKDNQLDAAETLLIAELGRRPDRRATKTNLGLLYANTGRSEQAVSLLAELVAQHPGACAAQIKLAQLHRAAYRFDEAEAAYAECLHHEPNHPAALLNLGILYELYRGDFNAALVQYERYQAASTEPDRRVEGWIADLSRRDNQIAEVQR